MSTYVLVQCHIQDCIWGGCIPEVLGGIKWALPRKIFENSSYQEAFLTSLELMYHTLLYSLHYSEYRPLTTFHPIFLVQFLSLTVYLRLPLSSLVNLFVVIVYNSVFFLQSPQKSSPILKNYYKPCMAKKLSKQVFPTFCVLVLVIHISLGAPPLLLTYTLYVLSYSDCILNKLSILTINYIIV